MATGSIRQKKTQDGIHYQVVIEGGRDPLTGKRVRAFKTVKGSKREANAVMHQMIAQMNQGIITQKRAKLNVGTWMDQWIALYLPNIEETTRIGYQSKIKCYIKPALGKILLESLRANHVQKMVNDMLADGLSPKNIRDTFNNVNAAMKQAVKLRMIPYNPCEGVVLPKLKRYKAQVYDVREITDLLTIAKGTSMYIPILLCVTVGLRRGELLALRWEHIDFEKELICIRENMVRGEKGYVIKAPKTEAGIRDVHVGKEVIQELRHARAEYCRDLIAYGVGFHDDGFIVRQENGKPLTPDVMSQKWRRFIAAHDLPSIRFHDLRHSNATALIQAGVNPKVVQQRLGHADVSVTLNTYTHVLPEMDIEAADKLDAIMLTGRKKVGAGA